MAVGLWQQVSMLHPVCHSNKSPAGLTLPLWASVTSDISESLSGRELMAHASRAMQARAYGSYCIWRNSIQPSLQANQPRALLNRPRFFFSLVTHKHTHKKNTPHSSCWMFLSKHIVVLLMSINKLPAHIHKPPTRITEEICLRNLYRIRPRNAQTNRCEDDFTESRHRVSQQLDWARRRSRFRGVDLVLAGTDSSRRSAASSKLDSLRYHRETAVCSSNDKHWRERNKQHGTDYHISY